MLKVSGDGLYAGFSRESKPSTELAPTAKVPLLTRCPTYDKVVRKPILPEKLRVREVLVSSDLKIRLESSQFILHMNSMFSPNLLPSLTSFSRLTNLVSSCLRQARHVVALGKEGKYTQASRGHNSCYSLR